MKIYVFGLMVHGGAQIQELSSQYLAKSQSKAEFSNHLHAKCSKWPPSQASSHLPNRTLRVAAALYLRRLYGSRVYLLPPEPRSIGRYCRGFLGRLFLSSGVSPPHHRLAPLLAAFTPWPRDLLLFYHSLISSIIKITFEFLFCVQKEVSGSQSYTAYIHTMRRVLRSLSLFYLQSIFIF